MPNPKSESLFHFTKSLDGLLSILKNGFFPRFCVEDHTWFGMSDNAAAYPIVCFCDIPLSRIKDHTDFYGAYGIGLTREWAQKNHLEPVIYSAGYGSVLDIAKYLWQEGVEADDEKFDIDRFSYFSKLARYIKPIKGKMTVGGEILDKEFYQENEWRYAPHDGLETKTLFKESFDAKREEENKKLEKKPLEIAPQDIKYIFVSDDTEIPQVVDFINTQLGHFPHTDLKILLTRVLSLNSVENDL